MADLTASPLWLISLWQPWASLIFAPGRPKLNETRHWPAPPRLIGKRIGIHAAKRCERLDDDDQLAAICRRELGDQWRATIPRGAMLGTVILSGCAMMGRGARPASEDDFAAGDWTPGRFAWALAEPMKIEAMPLRGRQGFWLEQSIA